jgi:Tfp pilus assembly protein PilV
MERVAKRMRNLLKHSAVSTRSNPGFSLIECIIALLVLMIGSLAVVSVLNFAFRSNADAKKRFAATLVAQQRIEDLRNLPFDSLTAGTVVESNVLYDGVVYTVTRTIVDNDLIATSEAPGPETKKITVSVRALNNPVYSDTVTLVTYRMVPRPGPNREPNPPVV